MSEVSKKSCVQAENVSIELLAYTSYLLYPDIKQYSFYQAETSAYTNKVHLSFARKSYPDSG